MSDDRELVFVYGTLRKEGSNHFRMAGAVPAGGASVAGRLYRIDWYPGLVLDEGAGPVWGGLYEVEAQKLAELDAFEGEEFERVRAVAEKGFEIYPTECWLWEYRGAVSEENRIPSGDWIEHVRPRSAPLFVWVAWMPVLFALWWMLLPDWIPYDLGPAMLVTAPVVMIGASWIALKRRERPDGVAEVALVVGLFGVLLLGILALSALFGLWT